MKKCFKLVPSDWNEVIYILFLLILLLAKTYLVLKKRCSKRNLIKVLSYNDDKIIFILLIKVIIFYMGFTIIHIWKLGF